jgi:transcriptional regulator with XRE-family HTH domain
VRRKLTLDEVGEKIGVSRQVVAHAERGKPSVGIAVYAALLWTFGLLEGLGNIADPSKDQEGLALVRARDPSKAYRGERLDNDF